MKDQTPFSDEELTAYLDGEADYARMEEINRAMAHDRELCARLEQLSINKSDIVEVFDQLLTQAPPSPKLPAESNKSRSLFSLPMSMAAVLIAGLGFFVGLKHNNYQTTPDWQQYAAIYQALYVNSTLSHINNSKPEMAKELARVSLALGKNIELSNVSLPGQLDYKRAQVLGFEGQPLIQLAFLSSMDTPIALCIMRSTGTEASSITLSEMQGMSAATWEKNGYAYLLIGGIDTHLIEKAAEQFALRL